MGRVDGKVAFITGAARGMGRSHAVRLAEEGADIIVTDISGPVDTVLYPPATPDELQDTARAVEELGRRVYSYTADVRDFDALKAGLDAGVAELGGLDIAIANAGIVNDIKMTWELDEANWTTMIDVNLNGVWRTAKAAIPYLMDRGPGGSLILISSVCGQMGCPGIAHYSAAKHGVVGLRKALANELGPHMYPRELGASNQYAHGNDRQSQYGSLLPARSRRSDVRGCTRHPAADLPPPGPTPRAPGHLQRRAVPRLR